SRRNRTLFAALVLFIAGLAFTAPNSYYYASACPSCEAIGLLKMDFLGLRNLTVIGDALENIQANRGVDLDMDHLPLNDPATYELLARGDTLGVFQLDGSAMRDLLRRMQPTGFEDIVAVLALYRPGPMGMNAHNDYADRKNGRQEVKPIHPELEEPLKEILADTFGLIALVCVPPYHIAGVGAALSNLYAGRTTVYLRHFDAQRWITLVREEAVTNATVVPTMLDRIVTALRAAPGPGLPSLRTLAYGGSRAPMPLVRATLELLPEVGLVNAYGLTETSSTIAVSTPEDHRIAFAATDPAIARRLGSVGRAVPGIELQIRAEDGTVLTPGEIGELFVRGPQVSGVYRGLGSVLDDDGWFPTRDLAALDADGYLFIGGRSDDTIIRGGENIAPAEIEDVLVEHPEVAQVAVVGLPDQQWGQILVADVVLSTSFKASVFSEYYGD
ncbi:AMP-binding protein, partial [Gordonia aichiensis]